MEPEALVESLEGLDIRRGAALLRSEHPSEGFSRAYLNRLVLHFGSDQAAALRLGIHCHSVLRHGDRQDLAYRAMAIVELIHGRWRSSARLFLSAGDTAEDPVERLSFKVGALHALGKAGRIEEAIKLGRELIEGLNSLDQPSLAARAALNLGNVLLEGDRYAEAIEFLNDATPALNAGGYATEEASAHLALSTANLFGGSLKVANDEATRVVRRARRLGSPHLERLARINLAHIALLRGRADEALDEFIDLERTLGDVPSEQARCLEFLGDAYLRLNLWDEAIDAYMKARRHPAIGGKNRANVELGLGQSYAGSGEVESARQAFERAYKIYRRLGNLAWASAALSAEASLTGSVRHVSRAKKAARDSGSPYHLAAALLLSGDAKERAEARQIIRKYGFAGLEWRAHYLEARSSAGANRLRAYRKMAAAIERERVTTRSSASRASFLRDKTEALREYLDELLRKPTPRKVDEAVSVVASSRSVALIDEVLAAGYAGIGNEGERLRALRAELQALSDIEPAPGAERRVVGRPENLASIQRRWRETTRSLFVGRSIGSERARSDTALFVQARDRIYAIVSGRVFPLGVDASEIEERLKWLHFELTAPMVTQKVDAAASVDSLREIGELVLGPIWRELPDVKGVCADGFLWQLPWDACLVAMGCDRCLEMRLHPGFHGGEERPMESVERVALWISSGDNLIHARREVELFRELYPKAEVFDSAESIRSACEGRYDLIHVVGHARKREANPMFSYFAFPDGPLYATEVAHLPFRTELAVLSACETGALSLVSMDEPDGLARAFLARGSAWVVASGWPFDDEAALRFTEGLYRSICKGLGVTSGLREARANLRGWNAHPYYWGCPVLYGGYRA